MKALLSSGSISESLILHKESVTQQVSNQKGPDAPSASHWSWAEGPLTKTEEGKRWLCSASVCYWPAIEQLRLLWEKKKNSKQKLWLTNWSNARDRLPPYRMIHQETSLSCTAKFHDNYCLSIILKLPQCCAINMEILQSHEWGFNGLAPASYRHLQQDLQIPADS